jgi:hypothetical protein
LENGLRRNGAITGFFNSRSIFKKCWSLTFKLQLYL